MFGYYVIHCYPCWIQEIFLPPIRRSETTPERPGFVYYESSTYGSWAMQAHRLPDVRAAPM